MNLCTCGHDADDHQDRTGNCQAPCLCPHCRGVCACPEYYPDGNACA